MGEWILRAIVLAPLLAAFGATTVHGESRLPNQPAIATEDDSGNRQLQHWTATEPTASKMKERAVPNRAEFAGAELWLMHEPGKDPQQVAVAAFARAGMQNVVVAAHAPGNPAAMHVLDSHPESSADVVMVTGEISGNDARGIALLLYGGSGDGPTESGVHAFMAPAPVFEALGGYAIVAVKWLQASASIDSDMREDGAMAPLAASRRLNEFFAAWVEGFVMPMLAMSMQMQMQSIQSMQSWSNAMNTCAGDASCSVVPSADGSGNWEAQTQ
ncbi:MAG: hypothetical protein AAGH76_02555 [Pseudomonadota bacterium]